MLQLKKEIPILVILIIATFLLFASLTGSYLWEDEAETAVIARNILHYGLPVSFDGVNVVTQEWGHDSNAQHVWTLQTWLPHYVTALSFLILGVNTFAARLPSVLLALFSIWFFYRIIRETSRDEILAWVSALFLTTSVTFLLHARQCRYYLLFVFLALLWTIIYWGFLHEKNKPWWLPAIIGALLFHTQYLNAVCWLAATAGVSFMVCRGERRRRSLQWPVWAGICALTLPWIIYARAWEKANTIGLDVVGRFVQWLVMMAFNLITVNHFILPLAAIPFVVLWFMRKELNAFERYLILSGTGYFLLISASPLYPDIRYLLVLVPWASFILGKLVVGVWQRSRLLAVILTISLVFTNIWSMPVWWSTKWSLPAKLQGHYRDLRYDLVDHVRELFVPAAGPVQQAVTYLNARYTSGQTLFVTYEAEPFIFYTPMRLIRTLPFTAPPDVVILRGEEWYKWLKWVLVQDAVTTTRSTPSYQWNYSPEKDGIREWSERKGYIEMYLRRLGYRRIELEAPNALWENRPTLLWHRFEDVPSSGRMAIYCRTR